MLDQLNRKSFKQTAVPRNRNDLQNLLRNPLQLQKQFTDFSRNIMQAGKSPEAMVKEMLSTGQMSKEQFNYLSNMANSIAHFLK